MSILFRGPRNRPVAEADLTARADEVLGWLVPETEALLASLHGAAPGVAQAVIQFIPFGSRAALLDQGVLKSVTGSEIIALTPLGFAVIAAAHASREGRPRRVVSEEPGAAAGDGTGREGRGPFRTAAQRIAR